MTTATRAAVMFRSDGEDDSNVLDERLTLLGLRQPPQLPTGTIATGTIATGTIATGTIALLRALVPKRPLGIREAEGVAERQANRLRVELGILGPTITEGDLAGLAWLTITRREGFPTSGMATKTDFGWIIVLNAEEAMVRQRFSLAHEIKHVLDDGLIDIHGGLYPATRGYSSEERTERVCDRFAAALLMPKVLLRADWSDGLQDIARLAKRYWFASDSTPQIRGLVTTTSRVPP